jgi:SynChlorMet cassette radical SAM/SPASM protein ScmE
MRLMQTPKSMDLSITCRCNLRCAYCSHFSSANEVQSDIGTEEWLRFFEELNRCAVLRVTLSGGEPFARSDLGEILGGIVRNRMRFGILSNGTMIDEDMAGLIASTGRCDSIQVSIDGSGPENHDACRGEGNFEKALRGIKILQRHRIPVTVRVTIHRHNVHDLENIAELLLDELSLPGFSTNAASYMGLCRQNAQSLQLTAAERSTAMKSLLALAGKYHGRVSAAAGPLAEARHWMEMERARHSRAPALVGAGYLRSCGGGFSQLAVRADGAIVPCSQMGHIDLGRINRDDLREVWHNHPELKRLRMRREIPLSEFAFCHGCEYIPYCRGNCPALAYTILGEENHPSPDACLRKFLEGGGTLPRGELVFQSGGGSG